MTAATLEEARKECMNLGRLSSEYHEKMVHKVPSFPEVDRVIYCTAQAEGKVCLSLGCTGDIQKMLNEAASTSIGIDKYTPNADERPSEFTKIDLDAIAQLSPAQVFVHEKVDVIVAGETLEHLTNPGTVLLYLKERYPETPLVVTVPNAFGSVGMEWMLKKSVELVNKHHVAWYSYWTLKMLLEKTGWSPQEWRWYKGKPLFAEGLICKAV